VQIPSFPDILSLLKPPGGIPVPADPSREEPRQTSEHGQPADTLSLSGSPSDGSAPTLEGRLHQAASEAAGSSGSLDLGPDGTYAPSVQMSRRSAAAFGFGFNLNIRSEATLDPAQHLGADLGQAALHVREATGMAYRSSSVAARSNIGGSFIESRKASAELFYTRTRDLSVRLGPEAADDFASASSSVGRTFELDIELGVSFLDQFIHQTEDIQELDTSLLTQYLRSTDALAGPSGSELQAFFDDVDKILEGTEQFMADALDSFLQQASDTFGLTQDETDALQQLVSDQVSDFFAEIDAFLADARAALTGLEQGDVAPLPEPALALPESPPEPENTATETGDLAEVTVT